MATAARALFQFTICVYIAGALVLGVVGGSNLYYFRDDYKFYAGAGGWLKLHRSPSTWNRARFTCEHEGGSVFASPLHEGLLSAMRAELQSLQVPAFTGIRALSTYDYFFSVEGVSMEIMPIRWDTGQPNNIDDQEQCITMAPNGTFADVNCTGRYPFLCYKENTGKLKITECGTTDEGYRKNETTGSCYKFHRECVTWWRAHATCAAEGGLLVVINSDGEAQAIQHLLAENRPEDVSCRNDRYAFIGIYNWMNDPLPVYWTTVDGKSLEKAGFARWAQNEPSNSNDQEYCGTVARENPVTLNDLDCERMLPFICELQPVDSFLSTSFYPTYLKL